MGRPLTLTADLLTQICEHLEDGASLADAAALSGVGKGVAYEWNAKGRSGLDPYTAFTEAVTRARAQFRQGLIGNVKDHAKGDADDSWRAALALYKELCGSSRGAERAKAREEITEEILDRLRTRLDTETFGRVVAALCDESSGAVQGEATVH